MKKEVYIIGDISKEDISAEYIRSEIAGLKAGDTLVCYIHTDGGYVDEGYAIYNLIKNCAANKTAIIIGTCASMGTVIAMAFDKILISHIATYMVHEVQTVVRGTADDLLNGSKMVDMLNKQLLDVYSKKTGKSIADLKKDYFKKADTFLSPQQAVDEKFVDGFYENTSLQIQGFSTMDSKAKKMAFQNLFKNVCVDTNIGDKNVCVDTNIGDKNVCVDTNIGDKNVSNVTNYNTQKSTIMKEKMFAIFLANLVATNVFTENDRKGFEALAKDDPDGAEAFLKEKQETFAKLQAKIQADFLASAKAEVVPPDANVAPPIDAAAQEAWQKKVAEGVVAKSLLNNIQAANAQNATAEQILANADKSTWTMQDWLDKDPKGLAAMMQNEPQKAERLAKAQQKENPIFKKESWQ